MMLPPTRNIILFLFCLSLASSFVFAEDLQFCNKLSASEPNLQATGLDDTCYGRISSFSDVVIKNYENYIVGSTYHAAQCQLTYSGVPLVKDFGVGASKYILRLGFEGSDVKVLHFPQSACSKEKAKNPSEWSDLSIDSSGPKPVSVNTGFFEPLTLDAAKRCIDESKDLFDLYIPACTQLKACGNKIVDYGEQCDDGNSLNTDYCSSYCQTTLPYVYGDLNLDGKVSTSDLQCYAIFNDPGASCSSVSAFVADVTCDDIVNTEDSKGIVPLLQGGKLKSDLNGNGVPNCKEFTKGSEILSFNFDALPTDGLPGTISSLEGIKAIAQVDLDIAGKLKNAFQFSSATYVEVQDAGVGNFGNGDFSVEAWIKPGGLAYNGVYTLLEKFDTSDPAQYKGYSLRLFQSSNTQLQIFINSHYEVLSLPITQGKWNHLVVSVQRNNLLKIYVDGVLASKKDISSYKSESVDTTTLLEVGRSLNAGVNSNFFLGSIDELRVYKGLLDPDTVVFKFAPLGLGSMVINPVFLQPGAVVDAISVKQGDSVSYSFAAFSDVGLISNAVITASFKGYTGATPPTFIKNSGSPSWKWSWVADTPGSYTLVLTAKAMGYLPVTKEIPVSVAGAADVVNVQLTYPAKEGQRSETVTDGSSFLLDFAPGSVSFEVNALASAAQGYGLFIKNGELWNEIPSSTPGKYTPLLVNALPQDYRLILNYGAETKQIFFTITLLDKDNDLVIDSIENALCLSTPFGKIVDEQGCLVGDLDFNGIVNTDDVEWIKSNPSSFWNSFLHKDIKNLNLFIKNMVENWS
ncbi:hypothetical protein HYT55_00080 [Candidatus Woesearchaeota archaeon]|nr:hypothetical protein [Candidatus Woesearchaeota archaeon]